jgi:hypothetical protein
MDLLEGLRENKLFGDIKIIKFEKEVIYRSSFIHTLCRYVQIRYGGVNLDLMLDKSVLKIVEYDKAVIGLLAMIL